MSELIEYTFYDGDKTTSVDRQTETIIMDERSGWSRRYKLTFKELLKNAKEWDISVDLNDSDAVIAEIATNIILANNAAEHGLDPFRYLPRSDKITDPKDRKTLEEFKELFEQYSTDQIVNALSEETKQALIDFLSNEE